MLNLFFIKILEFIYKAVNFFRRRMEKGEKISGKIIVSVGNIGFGGSGKTPLVIGIARLLKEKGIIPAIFLRGYRGEKEKEGGEVLSLDPFVYGDEACLLKRNLPELRVFVGKDRVKNMKKVEDKNIKVFILDDGFQYFGVKKDIEIIIFDKEKKPFLRRDFIIETRKADFVVKTNNKDDFSFHYSVKGVYNSSGKTEDDNKIFVAFCGIGNPESFKKTLQDNKILFESFIVFPDHYEYKEKDVKKLLSYGKSLITTEKDFVKLEKYGIKELYYLKIETVLSEKFKKEFLEKVEKEFKS